MEQSRAQALEIAVDRIYDRSEDAPNGCLLWTGPVNGSGYATIRIPGYSTTTAHRAMYEWVYGGPLPKDMHIDHTCHSDNLATCTDGSTCLHRRCVQPTHLELVTRAENGSRGMRANMTHCKRGHEFTPENTWTRADGRRHCRACRRYHMRAASPSRAA